MRLKKFGSPDNQLDQEKPQTRRKPFKPRPSKEAIRQLSERAQKDENARKNERLKKEARTKRESKFKQSTESDEAPEVVDFLGVPAFMRRSGIVQNPNRRVVSDLAPSRNLQCYVKAIFAYTEHRSLRSSSLVKKAVDLPSGSKISHQQLR